MLILADVCAVLEAAERRAPAGGPARDELLHALARVGRRPAPAEPAWRRRERERRSLLGALTATPAAAASRLPELLNAYLPADPPDPTDPHVFELLPGVRVVDGESLHVLSLAAGTPAYDAAVQTWLEADPGLPRLYLALEAVYAANRPLGRALNAALLRVADAQERLDPTTAAAVERLRG